LFGIISNFPPTQIYYTHMTKDIYAQNIKKVIACLIHNKMKF